MNVVLIRHALTRGNLEGRYIGARTDEPLCPEGIASLQNRAWPKVGRVFSSPMMRCLQTASFIYPNIAPEIIPDFRECDFGAFEGLNYSELNGRADYQRFIDSGGVAPFPAGERRRDFAARCVDAYAALIARDDQRDCALIVHGGTIMAIMERFARPKGDYFDFQIKNGEGYILRADGAFEPFSSISA